MQDIGSKSKNDEPETYNCLKLEKILKINV